MELTRREFSVSALSALLCGALRASEGASFELNVRTIDLKIDVPTPFSFLHFSDTHLTKAMTGELAAVGETGRALHEKRTKVLNKNARSFAAVISRIRETKTFAVNTGDLLDYVSEGGLASAAVQQGLDILSTPGNHEVMTLDPAKKPKGPKMFDWLGLQVEKAYGCKLPLDVRTVKGVKFVAFDNSGLSRYRMKEALGMMEREFRAGLPTVLCCHFPLYTPELLAYLRKGNKTKPAIAWMMTGEEVEGVPSKPEAKAIVDFLKAQKNLKAVLAGHLHSFWKGTFHGTVPMIVAPANFSGMALEYRVS